jgi:hypothetical protein
VDGCGIVPFTDPYLRILHRRVLRRLGTDAEWPVFLVWIAARLRAVFALPGHLWRWSRNERVPARHLPGLAWYCWRWGLQPIEARAYRRLGPSGPRPIFSNVLAQRAQIALGAPEQREVVKDKVALVQRLAAAGLPVVDTIAVLWEPADLMLLTTLPPGGYFIKPRYGQGGHGASALHVEEGGLFRLGRHGTMDIARLVALLHRRLERQPFLLQPFVSVGSGLPMARPPGAVPLTLRLTTARPWGGEAVLHGAYLTVGGGNADDYDWRHWVRFPMDPENGRIEHGVTYGEPDLRVAKVPWDGTPIVGRSWPDFQSLRGMVLKGADLVPDVPMVGWDLLPGPAGPVFLEGNVLIGSFLPDLRTVLAGRPSRLPELLAGWVTGRESRHAAGTAGDQPQRQRD